MATLRKTSSGKWEAAVCVRRIRKSRSFASRKEAARWASIAEEEMKAGAMEKNITLKALLEEYSSQELGKAERERTIYSFRKLEQDPMTEKRLEALRLWDFEDFVERRSQESTRCGTLVLASTINKDLKRLAAALNYAVRRGYLNRNPMTGLRRPKEPPHRERTASPEEIKAICEAAGWSGETPPADPYQRIAAAFCFSCETGMRAGEISAMESDWVNASGRVLTIPAEVTKTQTGRAIPLSSRARKILGLMLALKLSPTVFEIGNIESRTKRFIRLRNKAGCGAVLDESGHVIREALHFHDARATFATNAAKKIGPMDLSRITGHKDLKMLMRYYRPTAEELADKLG